MVRKGVALMRIEKPYFMNNPEWYYFEEDEFRYKLTDKAPEEAKKSYKEFYSEVYDGSEGGDT